MLPPAAAVACEATAAAATMAASIVRDRERVHGLSIDVLEVAGSKVRRTSVEHDELRTEGGGLIRRVDEGPLAVAPVGERRRQAARLHSHTVATKPHDVHEGASRPNAQAVRTRARRID